IACASSFVMISHPPSPTPFPYTTLFRSHPPLGARRPDDALEPRAALSPAPPRGPRGGLPGGSTIRRRAPVPAPGRAASARGAASSGGARRSRQAPTSTARCRGACPERADHHPGVAGGAPERGLGDRCLAPPGPLDAGRQNHLRSNFWDMALGDAEVDGNCAEAATPVADVAQPRLLHEARQLVRRDEALDRLR